MVDLFGRPMSRLDVERHAGALSQFAGVRLMTQLSHHFAEHPEVRYGLTSMCVGLGMGGTVIWENPHHEEYGK